MTRVRFFSKLRHTSVKSRIWIAIASATIVLIIQDLRSNVHNLNIDDVKRRSITTNGGLNSMSRNPSIKSTYRNYFLPIPKIKDTEIKGLQIGPSCTIPRLTPNGSGSYALDASEFTARMIPYCLTSKEKTKFAVDVDANLIRLDRTNPFWNDTVCFFNGFRQIQDQPDFHFAVDKHVHLVNQDEMPLPSQIENIYVWCKERYNTTRNEVIYEDYLSAIRPRRQLEVLLDSRRNESKDFYSVAIFGMDSSSHMSFRRFLPKSHDFLVQRLGAIEFNGFNSLGPGTLWSFFPLLTGLDLNDFRSGCWKQDEDYFDNCSFIWKEFEGRGYRTSYAEDDLEGGPIFNDKPKRGFSKQPVHYDFRPVAVKLGARRLKGHGVRNYRSTCHGSNLTFQVLLDRMIKMCHVFRDKPFFHMSWTVPLTHNKNIISKFGDDPLVSALKYLQENKLLENTILILLSDHGMRYGRLRRETRQGLLEERLPLLYIVLPEKFKSTYPLATKNMRDNADKLTSTYDIHASFQDLINLPKIADQALRARGAAEDLKSSHAVSLFLPINPKRTCKMIHLNSIFCACASRVPINVSDPFVTQAALEVVVTINDKISKYPQCAPLTFSRVISADRMELEFSEQNEMDRFKYDRHAVAREVLGDGIELGFETKPGSGIFYASVSAQSWHEPMTVSEVTRISAYGNDGDCVPVKELRQFCYCAA